MLFQMADGLDYDDDDEVPTEEMVERMEERLELVQNQQKRLFLIIFQVKVAESFLLLTVIDPISQGE